LFFVGNVFHDLHRKISCAEAIQAFCFNYSPLAGTRQAGQNNLTNVKSQHMLDFTLLQDAQATLSYNKISSLNI